jgi:hypothetical protein
MKPAKKQPKPIPPKRPLNTDQQFALVRRETMAVRADLYRSGIMG